MIDLNELNDSSVKVMNGENENDKHDLNFFLDKQLQQKLLEADEHFLERDFTSIKTASCLVPNKLKPSGGHVINGNNSNAANKQAIATSGSINAQKLLKYLHSVHVCGWCPDLTRHYRKSENDVPPRSRGGPGITRESLFSRDSKSRPQNLNNFVFRHYADPRKYIEQYRREHACYDTTNSSATKSEFLDSRRFYAYNQYSPLAVGSQSASLQSNNYSYVPQPQSEMHTQSSESQPKSQHNQTPVLHYSNRREQQRQTISATLRAKNQHQYKLSKNSGQKSENSYIQDYTEEYIEALEISNNKQRNSGSAKERSSVGVSGMSMQKLGATKVNVPAGSPGVRNTRQATSGNVETSSGSHFHSHKLGQVGSGSRALESLSCIVNTPLDKQPQVRSATEKESSTKKLKSDNFHSSLPKNNANNNNAPNPNKAAFAIPSPQSLKNSNAYSGKILESKSPSLNNGCTVEDKPLVNGINHFPEEDNDNDIDLSSDSSAVSIGCLSTKCLGVEATVKPRPKLEASCTYHVFPNEFTLNQHQGYTPSLLWNPSKSALEKRVQHPHKDVSVEFGLPSPFRQSPHARPKTEESKSSRVVEFITKEFVADSKPINFCSDAFKETPRLATAPGLKTNTIKPDLPPTFALQGISKRPHFEAFGKKRGLSKTAMARKRKENKIDKDGGRKSKSASTDASNHSAPGSAMKLKPVTMDEGSAPTNNVSTTLAPVPYFKFWNSSLPPKSRERRRLGADKSCDLTMQQLAEMVLADEDGQRDQDLKEAAKKVLEQHSKSEVEQQSAAGIATGGPWVSPSVDRISQTELLESLRQVRQRPNHPVPQPLHLTFIQEDGSPNLPQNLSGHVPPLHGMVRLSHNNTYRNLHSVNSLTTCNKNISNDCDIEIINSSPATRDKREEKQVLEKKKRNKRWRQASCDGDVTNSESSRIVSLSQPQIRSKSQENIKRHWNSKQSLLHKVSDDHSLSHRRKIKDLIEKSHFKHRFGRQGHSREPSMLQEMDASRTEVTVNTTNSLGLFSKNQVEIPFLKIKHCSTSTSKGAFNSKPSAESDPPECKKRETLKKKEKTDSERLHNNNVNIVEKSMEPSPYISNVEDIINNLQTVGPSIPPLCGTGLENQLLDKSKKRNPVSKEENLSPLLSHPDLEKLTQHMSVKVRISHLKYSKAGHMKRSQTIHL